MAAEQAWFIAERAEALATVYLTRRDDLHVIPMPLHALGPGYDLLVQVDTSNTHKPLAFGVEVKGLRGLRSQPHRDNHGIFTVSLGPSTLQHRGLPVCLFLFTVDDERGYYHWLHKPVITPRGKAELRFDFEPLQGKTNNRGAITVRDKFGKLDNEAVDRIVGEVHRWYKASPAADQQPLA
jgi:hypothetical protein